MKFSKKILAAFLAALMAISMMPFTAFATTYDSSKVVIDNLREGDIITTSVNKIIGLDEYSLTLQAGGYGSDGGNAENTDLRISWPEFSNGSVVDDEVGYYPFDENGNQSDTWYVVALDHGWDTITLSGIAPAPLKATFTGNLVDTFETGIMNKFIGGDVLDYDTTTVQKDRAYEISRGVDDYGLIVVVSVPGNADFDPADISFTIGETVSRPVSDDNDDGSAAVWYYPPDENDDPKVYEFFVTKAAFTDSMVVDYTPSTPAEPAEEPTVTWDAATENIQIGRDANQSNPYDASYTKDAITVSATSEEGHTYIDGTRFSEAFMGALSGFVFTNSVANFSKIKLVFTDLSIAGYNQFLDSEYNVDPHWSSDLDSKTVTWEGDSNSVGLYAFDVSGTLDRIEFTYEEPAPTSTVSFTKVTDASQITAENIGTCTAEDAKAWALANWDDVHDDNYDVSLVFYSNTGELNVVAVYCYMDEDDFSDNFDDTIITNYTISDLQQWFVGYGAPIFICPAAAPAEPNNGTNITVADTISENFYIDGDYYGADAYVTVNYNHNSNLSQTANFNTDDPQKLSEMDKISGGDYAGNSIISVIQAPAQSTEPITINVYASQADAEAGTNPVDTITYSVYTYCRQIIEGTYEDDLKDLARATLDYAAAAQNYFEYNQGNMATKDNASNAYYGDVADFDMASVTASASAPGCIQSFSVVVKSDLEINLLSRTPISVESASIDTTGTSRFAAENTTNGDWYVVHISGIEPANMDNAFTVVTDKGNISMSANAIMKLMANSTDTNLVTLAKAMYLYGAAANTFFANQNS